MPSTLTKAMKETNPAATSPMPGNVVASDASIITNPQLVSKIEVMPENTSSILHMNDTRKPVTHIPAILARNIKNPAAKFNSLKSDIFNPPPDN